jgi:hypothetical protein
LAIAGFMAAAAAESLEIRRLSPARRFVMFVAVLAFALQSFITQTHIHGDAQGLGGIVKIATAPSAAQGNAPLHHGTADCPFCQAVIHAGVFVASATPLLHLPFVWVKTVALFFTARADSGATAHHWQSRAPPRL